MDILQTVFETGVTLQVGPRFKSYCSIVHFRRVTSIHQPTNAHIISHTTLLKHFKILRHVSILSDHHQGALFLAKVILQYSQFNSYLQTMCCGSISCCVVEQWLGVHLMLNNKRLRVYVVSLAPPCDF